MAQVLGLLLRTPNLSTVSLWFLAHLRTAAGLTSSQLLLPQGLFPLNTDLGDRLQFQHWVPRVFSKFKSLSRNGPGPAHCYLGSQCQGTGQPVDRCAALSQSAVSMVVLD